MRLLLFRCSKTTEKKVSIIKIKELFSKSKLGGKCFFHYVAMGETLLNEDNIQIISFLLEEGHIINLVTNLTCTTNISKLINLPYKLSKNLIFHASLHYIELKKRNKLYVYFENISKLKEKKISFHMNLTVCAEYMQILKEIKDVCLDKIGLLPNITVALNPQNNWKA